MQNYEQEFKAELAYFEKTLAVIKARLEKKLAASESGRNNLRSSRKEMWEDTAHSSNDFDNVVEMTQYLEELDRGTASYLAGVDELQKLWKLQDSPYFARVDFRESGIEEKEKIYIGRSTLMDDAQDMMVFDWRSPIASVFYRYELGTVQYQAPQGIVYGTISLKRQYEIKQGVFEYFFDANVQIMDEFLRKLLSKNASFQMTSIVETIQKDQDRIIRDSHNELLMVQGVAGSGKTSVALHRVAYLMYQGLSAKLSSHHIIILSPSALFAKYIANVLPELGEERVETLAFEDICCEIFQRDLSVFQTRNQFYEELMTCKCPDEKELAKCSMEFKASATFVTMLHRLVTRYEHKWIPFTDIVYNHRQLFDKQLLKAKLLGRSVGTPIAVRLKQIEAMILQEIREECKFRLVDLERFAGEYPAHVYESQAFARMLSIHENRRLLAHIRKFTELDYMALYRKMFHDKAVFYSLAKGLALPERIEQIRLRTDKDVSQHISRHEDALALAFLKTVFAGCDTYQGIKQVVIDEAQDYYPIHFEMLKRLFPKAKYTVLGDRSQTIEKQTTMDFYESVQHILGKASSALLTLTKSFRCSNQIIAFSRRFLDKTIDQECFSRDGVPPEVICAVDEADLDQRMIAFTQAMRDDGYKSVCILCKSLEEAQELHRRIKEYTHAVVMDDTYAAELFGVCVAPIYIAKGLEFDAVLVCHVDDVHYRTDDDKKLLYIASTRALHRLAMFYTGRQCRFLDEEKQEDAHDNG